MLWMVSDAVMFSIVQGALFNLLSAIDMRNYGLPLRNVPAAIRINDYDKINSDTEGDLGCGVGDEHSQPFNA